MNLEVNQNSDSHKYHHIVGMADMLANKMLQESLDLTYSQYLMMLGTKFCPDMTNQKFIAESMGVTEAAVSKQVDNLFKAGLLDRKTNPDNRRQNVIELTKKGEEVFVKAHTLLTSAWETLFVDVTKEERKAFNTVMDKMSVVLINEMTRLGHHSVANCNIK